MPLAPSPPSRIVIVGGGAGGLELAIRLARLTRPGRRAAVTLVDRRPTHLWKPRLHEVASGLLAAAQEEAGYAGQGRRHGFEFVLGSVERIDPKGGTLQVAATPYPADDPIARAAGGDLLPARALPFDTAVLAIGSTVNDFGTPGVREHCYTLDTPTEAERLHRAVLAKAARVKAGLQPDLKVAIVGGGTTGVELAAELRDAAGRLSQYMSLRRPDQRGVTRLEPAARPLPGSPREISDYARAMLQAHDVTLRFGSSVVEVSSHEVALEGGGSQPADLIVWASGVKAQTLAHTIEGAAAPGKDGRRPTDACLRLKREGGGVFDALYALGDCAAAPLAGGGVTPATAQAAHQQAALLARSLARQARGRDPLPFRYRYKGTLVSLGAGSAVGDVPGLKLGPNGGPGAGELRVSGAGAKLAYTALYEAHLAELYGVWRTAALALSGALRRSAQPSIKLYW